MELFITSTDTGVGKTYITALLGQYAQKCGFSLGFCKPFVSDCQKSGSLWISEDLEYLKTHLGSQTAQGNDGALWFYEQPLAPLPAQIRLGQSLAHAQISDSLASVDRNFDLFLWEGIGGVTVPLANNYWVSDMICELSAPALVVARPNLGTINHTLLSIEHLRARGIEVLGVILNEAQGGAYDPSCMDNAQIIEQEGDIPVIGSVAYGQKALPGALQAWFDVFMRGQILA